METDIDLLASLVVQWDSMNRLVFSLLFRECVDGLC